MDFALSEEQILLRDSVDRFVTEHYGFDAYRALARSPHGFSTEHWHTMAELGWLAMPFAESDGGLGADAIELLLLMEGFGRGLVLEPYLPTVVLGGGLISRIGTADQRQAWLGRIASGDLTMALAHAEPGSGYDLAHVNTTARAKGSGYVIDGFKSVVLGGPMATTYVVLARTGGSASDRDGLSAFLVARDAPGLRCRDYATVDGRRASDLTLTNVSVGPEDLLGAPGQALAGVEATIDTATLAVSAEALGIMEVLYRATVEYSKTREQFSTALGKFQALQHRMVDMFTETEQTRSLLYLAAMQMAEGSEDCAKFVSALKAKVGSAGRLVGQEAVQLHGGIGMTDELNVGHYFKRLTAIGLLFGNHDFHVTRFQTY